jgi:hypothetical protein
LAHATKDCDAFTSRQPKTPPRNIQALYDRYNIRGRTSDRVTTSSNKRSSSSRSSSTNRTSKQDTVNSSKKTIRVSYADAAKSRPVSSVSSSSSQRRSLDDSIHNPNNRDKVSDKGKKPDRDENVFNQNMNELNQKALSDFTKFAQGLSSLRQEIASLKDQVVGIDNRLLNVEHHLRSSDISNSAAASSAPLQQSQPEDMDSSAGQTASAYPLSKISVLETTTVNIANQLASMTEFMQHLAGKLGLSDVSESGLLHD